MLRCLPGAKQVSLCLIAARMLCVMHPNRPHCSGLTQCAHFLSEQHTHATLPCTNGDAGNSSPLKFLLAFQSGRISLSKSDLENKFSDNRMVFFTTFLVRCRTQPTLLHLQISADKASVAYSALLMANRSEHSLGRFTA